MLEPSPEANTANRTPFLITDFKDMGQVGVAAVAFCYICGFIVVTAYHGGLGITDYDAFRIQYLVAGILFFILTGIFLYFVGQHVLAINEAVQGCSKLLQANGAKGNVWACRLFAYSQICGGLTLASLLASILFLPPTTNSSFYAVAAIILLTTQLIYMVTTSAAREHVTRNLLLLVGVFHITALIGFLCTASNLHIKMLSVMFTGLFIGAIYADASRHIKHAKLYFLILFLVIFPGSIGHYLYGHMRSDIGGGAPRRVQIVFKANEVPDSLIKELQVKDAMTHELDLIADTDSAIYVGLPMQSHDVPEISYATQVMLDRRLIRAIVSKNVHVTESVKPST